MAFEGPQPFKFSRNAGAAVLAYRFLTNDASARAIHATAEGNNIVGVSQDDTADAVGKPVEVAGPPAITKITAGAALAIGDKVVPGTAGKAVAAGAAGTEYWGYLLEASAADLDVVTLMLVPGTV